MSEPAEGWYADPTGAAQLRWWDGHAWTEYVEPYEAAPPQAGAAPAQAEAIPAYDEAQYHAQQEQVAANVPPQEAAEVPPIPSPEEPSYWCAQITPENVAKFDELRDLYLGVSETAQSAVDQQCQNKVTINNLVATNDPNGAFDTTSEVATVDVDRSGTGKTQFTVPDDPTWGEYYKVDVKSFFPNE